MSLARALQQLHASPIPRTKEEDIAEKAAVIRSINEELQHIEDVFRSQAHNDEKTFLQFNIELYRCNELVTIFDEYLRSGKNATEPEYQELAKKLDGTKQKSLTVRALLFPPKQESSTSSTESSWADTYCAKL